MDMTIFLNELIDTMLLMINTYKELLMLPICLWLFSFAIKLMLGLINGGCSYRGYSSPQEHSTLLHDPAYKVNLDKPYKKIKLEGEGYTINFIYNFIQKHKILRNYFNTED